jgi:hypothetical protein
MSQDKTIFVIIITFFAVAPNMVGTARKNENSAADVRVSFETFHPQCWRHFEKLREPLRGIGIIYFECRQIGYLSVLND